MPALLLPNITSVAMNVAATPMISFQTRNVYDIIWCCFMTIFACTWIAVHPNIPAALDGRAVLAFRRAGLMVCGLIAPEIIILWAMRQWYSARKIAEAHKAEGWTATHGFYLQMGGFMLHAGNKALHPLQLHELEELHENGKVDWPNISRSEILDKSKGDSLTKAIVIIQTSWFLLQCIVRASLRFVITEIELVTLAFAALNAVTYFFWWNKPVDVRFPHPVFLKEPTLGMVDSKKGANSGLTAVPNRSSFGPVTTVARYSLHLILAMASWLSSFLAAFIPPLSLMMHAPNNEMVWIYLLGYIQKPAIFLLRIFVRIVHAISGRTSHIHNTRVPTFYAAQVTPARNTFSLMTVTCSVLGSTFGGIHCLAWNFQFPSPREQLLWRASSLIITCAPLAIGLISNHMSRQEDDILMEYIFPASPRGPPDPPDPPDTSAVQLENSGDREEIMNDSNDHRRTLSSDHPPSYVGIVFPPRRPSDASVTSGLTLILPHMHDESYPSPNSSWIFLFSMLIWGLKSVLLASITIVYIAARLVLLAQALLGLHSLPSGAFQDMEWTSFFPHF